ncbi:ROK family protein [Olivibacter sp. SDN3]|uniref:ROK family protein n=1 Tax=Olivibacter sp. SDN3 TaxID=2764720 RepID=UPI001651A4DE|nr:ROK family protein [Olivibacter sp. SDN3]QNL51544.1 ROK family protein [Olivibacter sp. SDN3]
MNIVGIDLGGTRIKVGLLSDGKLKALRITETKNNKELRHLLPLLEIQITEMKQETQLNDVPFLSLAFPGLVDTDENRIIGTSSKYEDAPSLGLLEWAKTSLGMSLKLENDARMACLGEWYYGAGMKCSNMVMTTLGTGIGTAVILDNVILRGKHFQAGILGGHFIIDYKNERHRCSCGRFGCVEATASNWTIEKLVKAHPLFERSMLQKSDKLNMQTLFQLSKEGDELARLLGNQCLDAWAAGIVNLIHAYDPEIVIIGGGMMHVKELVVPYLQSIIAARAWCPWGGPEIRTAHFPDTAALMGAPLLFKANANTCLP